MAFDGITIAAITNELRENCLDGRIYKITQPEKDEIMLTIKKDKGQYRVVLSANPSLPLVYITENNKVSPDIAPAFCMLLRKHLQNGRIVDIYQPDFERIIVFEVEHMDEMGDMGRKRLVVELMGKYSNIIFTDTEDTIIDSIKHISGLVSSVREVLPGHEYFVPNSGDKVNPCEVARDDILRTISSPGDPAKLLYSAYTGISPMIANEICASVSDTYGDASMLSQESREIIVDNFMSTISDVKNAIYKPVVLYEQGIPKDYCCVKCSSYSEDNKKYYDTVSEMLIAFYEEKEKSSRIKQRSVDLRKIVSTILERDIKKYDLQLKQLKDTEKMEKYKVYGELLHTYGYSVEEGAKSATVDNYYTGEKITIPLDEDLSAMDNAKKYFDKYGKLKRTKEALSNLTVEVKAEIDHLQTVMNSLDIAEKEEDLVEIKEELIQTGLIKKRGNNKKQRFKSKPFHYISSDGFHMYVGKNNLQNDELTFKVATGNDWWFHAKQRPGSHVIVKCENKELPDKSFEEAARLAAHYSKSDGEGQIEIDYIQKKHVKKSPGQPAGFVIYHTNYSMLVDGDISGIQRIE